MCLPPHFLSAASRGASNFEALHFEALHFEEALRFAALRFGVSACQHAALHHHLTTQPGPTGIPMIGSCYTWGGADHVS